MFDLVAREDLEELEYKLARVYVLVRFLSLDALDEIEEHAKTHVLQVDVEQRILEREREIGERIAQLGIGELLAHVVHEVGDDAGRVGAQRLGGRVAAAAQEGLVEELADVRKLDAQIADDVTRYGEQVLAHAHELGRTVAKELQDAVDDQIRVEHEVVLVRIEVGDERERLDLGGDDFGVDLL